MLTVLHTVPPTLQQATADLYLHQRLLDTHGQIWASLLWGHCSFLLGLGAPKVLFVPSQTLFPSPVWVLAALWCYGVNGKLLQEGLCHNPGLLHPEALPLQQSTSDPYPAGDTQTQFWLSLCGVSGFWWAQGLFEPSERLWWVWGLILNMISPLLPSCWGFSFALGHGVSPQGRFSATQPPLQYLPSCWGSRYEIENQQGPTV